VQRARLVLHKYVHKYARAALSACITSIFIGENAMNDYTVRHDYKSRAVGQEPHPMHLDWVGKLFWAAVLAATGLLWAYLIAGWSGMIDTP